jgi:coiled-coil domain-containing protein 12
MSSTNSLAAAAQDRQARLAQLRSLKRKQPSPDPSSDVTEKPTADGREDVAAKYLSGRNFDLETRTAKLGFEHAPDEGVQTLEKQAAVVSERVLKEAEKDDGDQPLDLFKLQPKRPNWDLKRDLKQRMEVLDVRTDNAIAKLVRERIAAQKKEGGDAGLAGGDMLEAVHVREREEKEEERREKEWEQGLTDGGP